MDGTSAREDDLRQQLHQLDREREGSALTPGELEKNQNQRRAILEELGEAAPDADDGPAATGGG